ncbi:hypothetical protein QJS10_CPB21g00283 [Acorus calamus]|uniref:PWWP domain-containing protein n=1 Tax=Acorus calamus TaxID=4465 RepID=A0AAV9C5P4_ACOCL|nr:hypothetical protein QJS10_CPB21g00283 [Acorus calamus]
MKRRRQCRKPRERFCLPSWRKHQLRSPGPRPRLDLSRFLSESPPGTLCKVTCCEGMSFRTASMDRHNHGPDSGQRGMPKLSLERTLARIVAQEVVRLNSTGAPFTVRESVANCDEPDTSSNGNLGQDCTPSSVESMRYTPVKSVLQDTGSYDSWWSPGSVVWVMDERRAQEIPSDRCPGGVLVQLFGDHKFAWAHPVEDLSQFDDVSIKHYANILHCYEERSSKRSEAFQNALQEALRKLERTNSYKQSDRSSTEQKSPHQQDQSPDKWSSLSSGRIRDCRLEEGRGKRKRKPKIYFDESTFQVNTVKRVRRLRIMRFLGLAAPAGSPFSYSS